MYNKLNGLQDMATGLSHHHRGQPTRQANTVTEKNSKNSQDGKNQE
jgi:hypothetical protein